jgi:uncharacterized protein (TIGR02677 family)
LNSVKAEEMMRTKEFLLFKDKLVEYLRSFIKGLQRNVGVIEEYFRALEPEDVEKVLGKVVEYEMSIPRMEMEISWEMLEKNVKDRYKSIYEWFVAENSQENEAGKLFDATNEIIRRITRYATQLSEKNALGANRREEYRKVAEIFLRCKDISDAHKMSAMVFGMERPRHFKGDYARETDSMNQGVYEEEAIEMQLKPRIRTYREKTNRSAIYDKRKEKEAARAEMLAQIREDRRKIEALEHDGRIDFGSLPVIEERVREILLKWLSDGLEDADFCARTDDGREYFLDMSRTEERCVVHCEDGNFNMPRISIVFQEKSR